MNSHLWYKFCSRLIDWLFRRRTIASTLARTGGTVCVVALSINFIVNARVGKFEFSLSTAGGVGESATAFALLCGLVVLGIGALLAVRQAALDIRRDGRSKVIVVEVRGLRDSADAPLHDAELGDRFTGRQEELLVDLRQGVQDGTIVDPDTGLRKLALFPDQLAAMRAGLDRRDIQVVVGALAPVPYLVLLGMYLDDESPAEVVDWDRTSKIWRALEGEDDGQRFYVSGLDAIRRGTENVVLSVSVSYRTAVEAIRATFAGWPVVELALLDPKPDVHWSYDKQNALVAQFVEVIASLASKEVHLLHMVLASPASLAVRLGMGYDWRNMPSAIVYQYEKSNSPPYPWGVRLPTHGISGPQIVRTSFRHRESGGLHVIPAPMLRHDS